MNGTVIDIPGISVGVVPFDMEDSTDKAYTITISDGTKQVDIGIFFGKIISINEKNCSSINK